MRLIFPKILLALVLGAGCYSWKTVRLEPNPDPSKRPSHIEITLHDGARVNLYRPEVRQDSLYGWIGETGITPVSYALSDIASARAHKVDGDKTAAFAIGISLLLLLAWLAGLGLVLASFE